MSLFKKNSGRISKTLADFQDGGKVYKIVTTCAIVGLFIAVGLLIMGIVMEFMSAQLTLTLAILAIICFFAIATLPWIKKLEQGLYRKTSIAFIAINAVCGLLWIIGAILVYVLYVKGKAGVDFDPTGYLRVIKIIIIISIQFLAASSIATLITKYKKSFLAFQIITYVSTVFVDLYVSALLLSVYFDASKELATNADVMAILGTPFMIGLFCMFLVFTAISAGIVKRLERNRVERVHDAVASNIDANGNQVNQTAEGEQKQPTEQDRLAKLQQMYDAGLITEDEYKEKKAEILKDL